MTTLKYLLVVLALVTSFLFNVSDVVYCCIALEACCFYYFASSKEIDIILKDHWNVVDPCIRSEFLNNPFGELIPYIGIGTFMFKMSYAPLRWSEVGLIVLLSLPINVAMCIGIKENIEWLRKSIYILPTTLDTTTNIEELEISHQKTMQALKDYHDKVGCRLMSICHTRETSFFLTICAYFCII